MTIYNQDKEFLANLISRHQLLPHPEGGWYKETYRSADILPSSSLPIRFKGDRYASTAIYFLLEQGNFSAFHRIQSDECWHFYAGGRLDIYVLHTDKKLEIIHLGPNPEKGEHFQYVVPAGCWFASRPAPETAFSFVGCTVSPGFDFADFELADVQRLSAEYPDHAELIGELCR
jgi:predicted cupin superfamily sugar epimerase